MFSNYFKIAIRQVMRHKAHNAINIAGLGIGLTVSLIISLFIVQELSYDRFHQNGDHIYLLTMTWKMGGTQAHVAAATSAAGPALKETLPQIKEMVRLTEESLIFNKQGEIFEEGAIFAVDPSFFEVFTFPLIAGNPQDALRDPLSLVITEKTAEKYFGAEWKRENILAKTLEGQDKRLYRIRGVAENPPVNSHIQFDALLSMSSLPDERKPNWDNSTHFTYLLLHPSASPAAIVASMPDIVESKAGSWYRQYSEYDLVPLHDLYLRNDKYLGIDRTSDIKYVYIFSAIAAMVMIIAVINYMNLSTARSLERAKEVGVRKTIGSSRLELFSQFMSESFLVTFVSLLLAIGLAELTLPFFNHISGKTINMNFGDHLEWLPILFLALLLIAILGGFYPSMILSRYKPVSMLKGKLENAASGLSLRRLLVILQFGVSILLISCTLMIKSQLQFMVNAKVGLDKEQLIALELDNLSRNNLSVLRKELNTIPGVEAVSASIQLPVNVTMRSAIKTRDIETRHLISILGTDPKFAESAGLEFIAGRNFVPDVENHSDRWEFLLNESALKFFNWSVDEALGKEIRLWGIYGEVKGVVRDFHFAPLHKPIEPLIISGGGRNAENFQYLLIRVQASGFSGVLREIKEKWNTLTPGSLFSFSFLDERYKNLYLTETRLGKIMDVFSGLAIFIASLGLLGLASYTIAQRTKEIGIRKVLGASVPGIVGLLAKDFIKLVLIANLLAWPLAYYATNRWLEDFAYRFEKGWWIFALAGGLALLIALLTVSAQAIKAALANPVEALRYE
ncbi:ABC transporter permease [candidate division KSB1 bacterium]|nr:ABC transporter permease [candidate division KSB1 bacterium]